jgi:hypothetical protein
MREHLLSNGWQFTGSCNCSPKMDSYNNISKYPGYEIQIASVGTLFRIKQGVTRNTIVEGVESNFVEIYSNQFA